MGHCTPFVGEAALEAWKSADDPRRRQVRLATHCREEPALRTTLLPPLLAARAQPGRGHRGHALELGLLPPTGTEPAPPRMGVTPVRPPTSSTAESFVPASRGT